MANVQYTVLYRYLHPVSNKPVTNKQKGYKALSELATTNSSGITHALANNSEFKTTDLPTGVSISDYMVSRNFTTDKIFDQLFVFSSVRKIIKTLTGPPLTTYEVSADSFVQVNGDPWFVASVTGSLESAMTTATRLVKKIGIGNVKLVKNVPIELEIGIE